MFLAEEEEWLQSALGLEASELSLVLDTVTFILQQAAYHLAKPSLLSQQLLSIGLSEEMVPALSCCLHHSIFLTHRPLPPHRSKCSCKHGLTKARRWWRGFAHNHSTQSR